MNFNGVYFCCCCLICCWIVKRGRSVSIFLWSSRKWHVIFTSSQKSGGRAFTSKISCQVFSCVPGVPIFFIFVLSERHRGSPAVWSAFSLSHVSFKEEMINVRLQVGGREATAMAENGTSWTVSRICSFEVFAEHSSAWLPDKWKDLFKDTLVLKQAIQTADCTSQSFVSTWTGTN